MPFQCHPWRGGWSRSASMSQQPHLMPHHTPHFWHPGSASAGQQPPETSNAACQTQQSVSIGFRVG